MGNFERAPRPRPMASEALASVSFQALYVVSDSSLPVILFFDPEIIGTFRWPPNQCYFYLLFISLLYNINHIHLRLFFQSSLHLQNLHLYLYGVTFNLVAFYYSTWGSSDVRFFDGYSTWTFVIIISQVGLAEFAHHFFILYVLNIVYFYPYTDVA